MAEKKKAGFWGLTKELAKEAQKIVGNTIEGVKSASEKIKVDAHKHHLEHIEKMKKLEKRAKDAGIPEAILDIIKKDLGITHEESADTQREFEGSAIYHVLSMGERTSIEEEFEKRLKPFLRPDNRIAKSTLDQDVAADDGSAKDAGISEKYPVKLKKDFGVTPSEPRKKIIEFLKEHKANRKRSAQEDINKANEYSKKGNEKESNSKPIFNSYFSSLIEKYLSNYQAIERGEILQGNVMPPKASHNNFRAVCRGEKKAVTAHEQAYMAWKKQDRPPQKGSTETTIDVDLP